MKIIDDFIDPELLARMRAAFLADDFPWVRTAVVTKAAPGVAPSANQQCVHGFFLRNGGELNVSSHFELVRPVLEKLRPGTLLKVKLNYTRRQPTNVEYGLHVDNRERGALTALFYFNTNDGYTVFEDGTRVESVENRLVVFDARQRHTGASCTDADYRLVLNINFTMAGNPADR